MFVQEAVADGSAENAVTVHADTVGEGEVSTASAIVVMNKDRMPNASPGRLE